jgi:hypothetical protein
MKDQLPDPEDKGITILLNVETYSPSDTASHTSRTESSESKLLDAVTVGVTMH